MDDLAYLPATEIAARIRSGQLSSRDALEAMLARIDDKNPVLNAVVTLEAERARSAADAAAAAIPAALGFLTLGK